MSDREIGKFNDAPAPSRPELGNWVTAGLELVQTSAQKLEENIRNSLDLEQKGLLPILLFDEPSPPPEIEVRSGTRIRGDQLKEEGIKCRRESLDGEPATKIEFPNGIEIDIATNSRNLVIPEGTEVELQDDGTIVDTNTGRPVARDMEDGSTRVWTDNGVYNVYQDGSITKESAFKIDGKWIIDSTDPLDGLPVDN